MSFNPDVDTWRLTTLGGIPIRIEARSGEFGEEDASATEVCIIQASQLLDFIAEALPAPVTVSGIPEYPIRRGLPGLTSLRTKKISWEGLTPGRPVDPFGTDPNAPNKTYEQFLRLTINYGTSPNNDNDQPDQQDPKTFLEISANASGEFITTPPASSAFWKFADEASGGEPVKERQVPNTIPVPELEWNVRWSQIPFDFFGDSLLSSLRSGLGKVNSSPMSLFFDSPTDTILFIGFTIRQQFTWRTGRGAQPPLQLEMKFLEKNFTASDGTEVTHQHVYRPNKGFQKLYIDGNLSFQQTNLDNIFLPA